MPATPVPEQSSKIESRREEAGDRPRPKSDWRQALGMNGVDFGTAGKPRRVLLYMIGIAAVAVGVVNVSNVLTWMHDRPGSSLAVPVVAEATSWLAFQLFLWVPWLAWLWAPPFVRPRWKLLVHVPAALAFALGHIGGFVILRALIAWIAGGRYDPGPFASLYLFEVRKDVLPYLLFAACCALIDHLLGQRAPAPALDQRETFDIRDGAKLTRVRIDDVLAVSSAGNYVEFVLGDGRRLLMRSSLSALESELAPLGFVRTHRSWLVNAGRVTALEPAGSGDYTVEVATLTVPLSRRFPQALARLRGAEA